MCVWSIYRDRGETIIKKTLQITILNGIVVGLFFLKTNRQLAKILAWSLCLI
jgi:hypothetical protein